MILSPEIALIGGRICVMLGVLTLVLIVADVLECVASIHKDKQSGFYTKERLYCDKKLKGFYSTKKKNHLAYLVE